MLAEVLTPPALMVAGLFMVAGVLKLTNLPVFVQQLSELSDLPAVVRRPAAVAVPALELVGAGLVVVPPTRAVGIWLLLALLGVFTVVVVRNILAGNLEVACACFGPKSERLGWHIPARNIALAGGLALPLLAEGDAVGMPEPAAWVPTVLTAVIIALTLEWIRLNNELKGDADRA